MTRQVNKHRTAASSSSSSRASLGYEAVGLSSSSNKILEQKTYMANQYRIFSITYGSFLCLVAIVLTTIEPFKACDQCENPLKILIEVFFTFMHLSSIIWFLVMFVLIVKAKDKQKVAIKSAGQDRRLSEASNLFSTPKLMKINIKKWFRSIFRQKDTEDDVQDPEEADESVLDNETQETLNKVASGERATSDESVVNLVSNRDVSKYYFTYDYENGTGELYMRVGTGIFAMCAMIDRFLSLIQMIEVYFNEPQLIKGCHATFAVTMISKIISILFIFTQSFFIFKYANIIINYGKNSAVVGLMHIVVTNFCVFFRTVVYETVAEIRHAHHDDYIDDDGDGKIVTYAAKIVADQFKIIKKNTTSLEELTARKLGCISTLDFTSDTNKGIQNAHDKLSAYLYPCIIEYSLMCLTVFFILWSSIEQRFVSTNYLTSDAHTPITVHQIDRHRHKSKKVAKTSELTTHTIKSPQAVENQPATNSEGVSRMISFQIEPQDARRQKWTEFDHEHENRRVNQFIIDCAKSTTGLFFGILAVLMTIISLIVYFIYRETNPVLARKLIETSQIILLFVTLMITLSIYIKFRKVAFNYKVIFKTDYNEALCIVGLAGVYLFGFYSIIAILGSYKSSRINVLSLMIQIVTIVESTLQSFLIINGLKMHAANKKVKRYKPGRSLVTLLILLDVSLWLSETFSIKKYDMNSTQLEFYGIVFWSIVSSISTPLSIFFRFHGSVCLSDMWKTLYELE